MRHRSSYVLASSLVAFGLVVACGDEKPEVSCFGGENCPDTTRSDSGSDTSATGDSSSTVLVPEDDAGTTGDTSVAVEDAGPPFCGDKKTNGAEACDDGNPTAGDGCFNCTVEEFWVCPPPGQVCTNTVVCGDGIRNGKEECDDDNTDDNDGCSAKCVVEAGFLCATPGAACFANCGDGKKVGDEGCDDDNTDDNDGCSAKCQLEDKYKCPIPGVKCELTVCGDGAIEGSEQCDQKDNYEAYDGCYECKSEPKCTPNKGCEAVCGDGLKYPLEACDDGNTRPGDGCSDKCAIEPGYSCTVTTEALPENIDIPIIYRDFKKNNVAGGHPDFEAYDGPGALNLVEPLLVNGHPRFLSRRGNPAADHDLLTSLDDFAQWYVTDPKNKVINSKLRLKKQSDDSYLFDSRTDLPNGAANPLSPKGYFWPLDGIGWQDPSVPSADRELSYGAKDGLNHNFFYTTEARFWFSYDATTSPLLNFDGDDDVWVFINGKLAVDIGGLHSRQEKGVLIHPTCTGVTLPANTECRIASTDLGLTDGNIYDIAVFQAERHTDESNYKLTLKGFRKEKSACFPICGDKIKTKSEVCDDGADNATVTPPPYGKCAKDCLSRGPFCGDTIVNGAETCDDGLNKGAYGSCTIDCKKADYCGDGVVQATFEQCDEGATGNKGGYGKCKANCQRDIRCGDGIVQSGNGEQCEPPNTPTCSVGCQTKTPG